MWSAARSAKISMILCMPERVSGGDAKFQGFCDGWNKWEGQAASVVAGLLGPVAIAAYATVLSLPVWGAWWWLAHRG